MYVYTAVQYLDNVHASCNADDAVITAERGLKKYYKQHNHRLGDGYNIMVCTIHR